MYKVLLVDDEFIILDGISSVIDWASLGTELCGTAQNGVEAMEHIQRNPPDIIITDIRMPGMDGLELVANVSELYPNIMFIILSGFSEFEYAKSAMQYGVKHYLLKPCKASSIHEALTELVNEIGQRDEREAFLSSIKNDLERMIPHAKEQFLKEFVTNKTYGVNEWDFFENLFGIPFQSRIVRLLLIQLEDTYEFEYLFAVKNIAEDIFPNPLLSTTVGGYVLLLMEDSISQELLYERIDMLLSTFKKYYRTDLTAALSESGELTQARKMFKQTMECLNYRFYLGEGALITQKDIAVQYHMDQPLPSFDEELLIMAMKAGNWEGAEGELIKVFQQLADFKLDISITKSYVIQIFMAIIRIGEAAQMNAYLNRLTTILESSKLQTIHQIVIDTAEEITKGRYNRNRNIQSQLVMTMKELILKHLCDETLSLQTLAGEIYLTPDYISKVFRKETGQKFTAYVMRSRMELAMEMLDRNPNMLINELAMSTGFGENFQYFSKVFKKFTGYSPSEYKKHP
jgi:two-component system, response regulator YesN